MCPLALFCLSKIIHSLSRKMPIIKTLAQRPLMKSNKGNRKRTSSPPPERATSPSPDKPNKNLSRDLKRQLRYEELKHWLQISQETVGARRRAIHERRVANLLCILNRSFQLGDLALLAETVVLI
ncbi:unnamed protein product [Sphenostylis stenocarpa]|uniref:Uncharacterized protein n=1 Tax=Sphenostylis stenocarpa TaxID=92480 RepID=A0AA86TA75_9FABA|nr:unnamed protein product [Sphenostylis stenocarpa]